VHDAVLSLQSPVANTVKSDRIALTIPITEFTPRRQTALDSLANAHQNDVWAVAFSPDGRYIVSGDTNGNVTLWNTATWKTCAHLGTTGLYELEVSLDGRWLASGGGHRDAYIWDFRQLAENCR